MTFTDEVSLPEGTLPRLVITRDLPTVDGTADPFMIESATLTDATGNAIARDARPE